MRHEIIRRRWKMKKVVVQKDFDLSTTKGKVQALAYLYPVLDAIEDDERRQKFVIAIDEALGITWLWA